MRVHFNNSRRVLETPTARKTDKPIAQIGDRARVPTLRHLLLLHKHNPDFLPPVPPPSWHSQRASQSTRMRHCDYREEMVLHRVPTTLAVIRDSPGSGQIATNLQVTSKGFELRRAQTTFEPPGKGKVKGSLNPGREKTGDRTWDSLILEGRVAATYATQQVCEGIINSNKILPPGAAKPTGERMRR